MLVFEWPVGKWISRHFNTNHFIMVICDNGKGKNGNLIHIRLMFMNMNQEMHLFDSATFIHLALVSSFLEGNAKIRHNALSHWISFGATLRYDSDKLGKYPYEFVMHMNMYVCILKGAVSFVMLSGTQANACQAATWIYIYIYIWTVAPDIPNGRQP